MRVNETRRLLDAGKPALGLFVSSGSSLTAESVGHMGFDWALIDLQHGENNLGNLSSMLQAVSCTPATPFVRVPINDPMLIQRSLDLGAYGVIVPLVNTREQAEAAVQAASYPPRGTRSWGPIRGSLYGGSDYFQQSSRELLLFTMLETAEAVANANDILSVEGVDGCYVGLNDLSVSLGMSPEGASGVTLAPQVEAALVTVLTACKATGKVPGIQLYGTEAITARIGQGFRLVGAGTELRLLRGAAIELLRSVTR